MNLCLRTLKVIYAKNEPLKPHTQLFYKKNYICTRVEAIKG